MQHRLDEKQQAVIPIAAYAAIGKIEPLHNALHKGLDAGITINELKEILTHLYAYCGFPRSLNAISALMAVLENRHRKGVTDETGRNASPVP
ncbi:carboxymuconolactone decarboxylase family protein [Citrobacter sp. JGM124]|uniref:carboxymuconolactone decarboxylase family protein n=1 Tax=Citrobacter sp. JGM124 TaxID=2799789 RepID=UPI0032C4132D